MISQTGLTNNI